MIFARILLIPVAGFFAFTLFAQFVKSLSDAVYFLLGDDYLEYVDAGALRASVVGATAVWVAALAHLETANRLNENFKYRRLLTSFRYAPVAVLFLSGLITIFFDLGMIEYSKLKIRNYVYAGSGSLEEPDFPLHNNYRHWCGNGAIAQENYLYFETAAEGVGDRNPHVRARSLMMTDKVSNWLNGGDHRFDRFLTDACRDEAPTVREVADSVMRKRGADCLSYLSTK